jgi:hypothetical protein
MLNIVRDARWIEKWQKRNESLIELIKHTNSDKQLLYFSLVNHFFVDCSGLVVIIVIVIVITLVHVTSRRSHLFSTTLQTMKTPQYSNLHWNKKDHLHILQWLIVSKIENKSLQIHSLWFASFILDSVAYCDNVSFVHFLILEKAIKYTWMGLSLCFCRCNIHKRQYSYSNRPFQCLKRGKKKWISDWRLQVVAKTDVQQALYLPNIHLKMVLWHFQQLFKCLPLFPIEEH